jgi:hypothetical protein
MSRNPDRNKLLFSIAAVLVAIGVAVALMGLWQMLAPSQLRLSEELQLPPGTVEMQIRAEERIKAYHDTKIVLDAKDAKIEQLKTEIAALSLIVEEQGKLIKLGNSQ